MTGKMAAEQTGGIFPSPERRSPSRVQARGVAEDIEQRVRIKEQKIIINNLFIKEINHR